MSCNIEYIKNGVIVRDNEGNISNLFKSLSSKYDQKEALEMFKVSHSDQFQTLYGKQEPSLETLEAFVINNNKTERFATPQEMQDVRNSMLGMEGTFDDFKGLLRQAFYKDELFVLSPKKLSKMYSNYEISNLSYDVKESVEAILNTEDFNVSQGFDKKELEYSDTFNSFGKLNYLNPHKVQQDSMEELAGLEETEFLQALQTLPYDKQHISFEEAQQYKKAQILEDVDGEIVEPSLGNRVVLTANIEKGRDMIPTIVNLVNISDEVMYTNSDNVAKLLGYVENQAIEAGIDVIGITEETANPSLKPLLMSMSSMLLEPTSENVAVFSKIHQEVFPSAIKYTQAIKKSENRDYVTLKTLQNEGDVYEQSNLLKIDNEGNYIRVNDKSLEELYVIAGVSEQENQRDATKIEGQRETAEKINLLRKIFNVNIPQITSEVELPQFTGDFNYLTGEYVSDFYVKLLKEKKKDSSLYQQFYSNFEVNERGINLKYTDDYTMKIVNEMADENLKQYSILSKQMPDLEQSALDENPDFTSQERDYYVNNPKKAPLLKSIPSIIEQEIMTVENGTDKFIRMNDNSLWENTQQIDGVGVYVKLPSVNLDYNIYNTPQPNLEDFDILAQKGENKEKNSKTVKNNEFACR